MPLPPTRASFWHLGNTLCKGIDARPSSEDGVCIMATTALEHPNHVKTHLPPEAHNPGFQPLATVLGLFSLGLGFAELLKPSAMQRATGVHNHSLLRGYGLREIISGIGILSTNRPVLWLWSRVVGDVIDMATLA